MTYLHISYDDWFSHALFVAKIAATPASVTILSLHGNNLGRKTGAELAEVFAAIPASVTVLNFQGNNLCNVPDVELAQAFAAIPSTVTELILRDNGLGCISGSELARALAALPCSVTILNLAGNYLGERSEDELTQVLAAIPSSVTTLHFWCNDLKFQSRDKLAAIFNRFPAHISTIVIETSLLRKITISNFYVSKIENSCAYITRNYVELQKRLSTIARNIKPLATNNKANEAITLGDDVFLNIASFLTFSEQAKLALAILPEKPKTKEPDEQNATQTTAVTSVNKKTHIKTKFGSSCCSIS